MTYNLYMLSKWTAEVANCVLEGLLGEYHISYIISYYSPLPIHELPYSSSKLLMVKLTLVWIQTLHLHLSQQQGKVTYVVYGK